MARRQDIELALRQWRDAERALAASAGQAPELQAEVDRARAAFKELAAEHMAALIEEERAER